MNIEVETPELSAGEWSIFLKHVTPRLRAWGLYWRPSKKRWVTLDIPDADVLVRKVYDEYKRQSLPVPRIFIVEGKKVRPWEWSTSPEKAVEEKKVVEAEQVSLIPKAEPPQIFYIIADLGQFHFVAEVPAINGKFRLYPEIEEAVPQVEDGQYLVKMGVNKRYPVSKEPDGSFILKAKGFKKYWKKCLKKLKGRYKKAYLKKRLGRFKEKARQRWMKEQTEGGEWYYKGEIAPNRNDYFCIYQIQKVIVEDKEKKFYDCADILEVKTDNRNMYVKSWTSVPLTRASFEPILRSGWIKSNVLSSYWYIEGTDWRDKYANKRFNEIISKLSDWQESKIKIPKFKGKALPHQIEALKFIKSRGNALLAMEPGTGKSLVGILHGLRLFRLGKIDKVVVFAPKTAKDTWIEEAQKWFGKEFCRKNVTFIEGTPEQRARLWNSKKLFLIANYAQAKDAGVKKLGKKKRLLVIADESTLIKNITAVRTKNLMEIPAVYKIAASGEPLEKSLQELHTIERWLGTKIFGSYVEFQGKYMRYKAKWKQKKVGDELNDYLKKTIMIRKKICEVDPDIPSPEIRQYPISLSGDSLTDYQTLVDVILEVSGDIAKIEEKIRTLQYRATAEVLEQIKRLKAEKRKLRYNVLSYLKAAHRFCDHPRLLGKTYSKSEWANASYRYFRKKFVSPKLNKTVEIIKGIPKDEKVIIFSQYAPMCEIIGDKIEKKTGRECMIMHGGYPPAKDRAKHRKLFEKSKRYNTLIMSDIGKMGLNFPFVHHMLLYDLPWNATDIKQRVGRIIRLGRRKKPTVYIPYITDYGKIEQIVRSKLNMKSLMTSTVIDGLAKEDFVDWLGRR